MIINICIPEIPELWCCHTGAIKITTSPMEAYLQKNFYKTGSLMANACRAAAMLENKDRTTCDAAFQYGRHVGLAQISRVKVRLSILSLKTYIRFQLVDDVLDFEGSEATLGKPALSDLRLGLVTAPTLLAVEEHPQLAVLMARNFSQPGDVDRAIDLVQDSDGIHRTKDLAIVQTELAFDSLSGLQDSEARDALKALAIKAATRRH